MTNTIKHFIAGFKITLSAAILTSGPLLASAYSTPSILTDPTLAPAVFDKVYVPTGFDSNDHVQIVGEGLFRSACYRPAPTDVRVDELTKTVIIGPVAYEYPGFCLQVVLPFDRVIEVGVLSVGTWRVVQSDVGKALGEINVKPATVHAADEFQYAAVSQAFYRQRGRGGEVLLSGYFINSCMVLDQIKTTLIKEAIVLQPIVKIHGDHYKECKDGRFPFSTVVTLEHVPKGRHLLHVRSMNGNAVNNLVDQQ